MAKRISLREFQQNLSMRLGSAQRGENSRALLGVASGVGDDSHWLFDLADSGEVAPLTTLTPAPLTKHWFAGLVNIRGALYSVVDFSALRGGEATPLNAEARLLLIGTRHGINSALLVNRTLGLLAPDTLTLIEGDVGKTKTANAAWRGKRYVDGTGGQWTRLRIPTLLADPAFLDVAEVTAISGGGSV